ncbi:MAG: ATP-binding cassette domain-containing protein, partial [Acidimicrobiales bacterium]
VEEVHFHYPRDGREVLRGVDLEIPAGTSMAIVGDNGAGKSTLVQLLCRLRDPTAGRITVDGADLTGVDPRQWQRSMAIVSQQALRLPVSARRNVAGGRDVATAELEQAAADAGAAGVIAGRAMMTRKSWPPPCWSTPTSASWTAARVTPTACPPGRQPAPGPKQPGGAVAAGLPSTAFTPRGGCTLAEPA